MKLYWHFLNSDKCLQFGSEERVKVKHTLTIPATVDPQWCHIGFQTLIKHVHEQALCCGNAEHAYRGNGD